MKLPFRQGIVRYQTDVSNSPAFLRKSNGGKSIDLVVSPDPTIVTFAHGDAEYLFEERSTILRAWKNLTDTSKSYWLYWDIDLLTAERTFGWTTVEPVLQGPRPSSPTNDQHWFDYNEKKMKVYHNGRWREVIRVFACEYRNASVIIPFPLGTQVGLLETVYSGLILFGPDEKPLRRAVHNRRSSFITTETHLITHLSTGAVNIAVEAALPFAEALENIPAFRCVVFKSYERLGLASYMDTERPVVGITTEDLYTGEIGVYKSSGIIVNENWNFTEPPNTRVFCGLNGEVTTEVPQRGSIQQIGVILDSDTILLDIKPQIILDEA